MRLPAYSPKAWRKEFGDPKKRSALWARVMRRARAVFPDPADRARFLDALGFLDRLRRRGGAQRLGLPLAPQAPDREARRVLAEQVRHEGTRGRPVQKKSAHRYAKRHLTPVTLSQRGVVEWTAWLVGDLTGALPRCGRRTERRATAWDAPWKAGDPYGTGLALVQAVLAWTVFPRAPRSAETVFRWLQSLKKSVRPKGKRVPRTPDVSAIPRLRTFAAAPDAPGAVGGWAALRGGTQPWERLKALCPPPHPSVDSLWDGEPDEDGGSVVERRARPAGGGEP